MKPSLAAGEAHQSPVTVSIMQASADVSVRSVDRRGLTDRDLDAWIGLEASALEPQPGLSPHFLLPALAHLDPQLPAQILFVEAGHPGARTLIGAGVFVPNAGTRQFPLPHLVAYRSRHSFGSGLLLDAARADDALLGLIRHAAKAEKPLWERLGRWHGLRFEKFWGDGPTYDRLRSLAEGSQVSVRESNRRIRATLWPHRDATLIEKAAAEQPRDVRRRMRRLKEAGTASWRLHRSAGVPAPSVESFLVLEHEGWKGEQGTSLRSHPEEEAFFREMVERFGADKRAIFCELVLNDRVIASTCNFVAGTRALAFKIGWDSQFAEVSPGIANELEMLRQMSTHPELKDLEFWDSGAAEGSYIQRLWNGRRPLIDLTVATTLLGRSALHALDGAKRVRQWYRERFSTSPASVRPATTR